VNIKPINSPSMRPFVYSLSSWTNTAIFTQPHQTQW
jgi:hypothetical protein